MSIELFQKMLEGWKVMHDTRTRWVTEVDGREKMVSENKISLYKISYEYCCEETEKTKAILKQKELFVSKFCFYDTKKNEPYNDAYLDQESYQLIYKNDKYYVRIDYIPEKNKISYDIVKDNWMWVPTLKEVKEDKKVEEKTKFFKKMINQLPQHRLIKITNEVTKDE